MSDFPDFSELDGLNLSGRFIGKQIPGLLEKTYQQIQQTLSVIRFCLMFFLDVIVVLLPVVECLFVPGGNSMPREIVSKAPTMSRNCGSKFISTPWIPHHLFETTSENCSPRENCFISYFLHRFHSFHPSPFGCFQK